MAQREECGGGGGGGGKDGKGKRDKEKKRKTRMIRVDGDHGGWVDIEVLDRASFSGAQWAGPDEGNLSQETILENNKDLTGNKGSNKVPIKMIGKPGTEDIVTVRAKACSGLKSRNNVDRTFKNDPENSCRNGENGGNKNNKKHKKPPDPNATCLVRIAFNNIDADNMDKTTGEIPSDPKKYRDAVIKSKDQVDLWLDVEIPKKFQIKRLGKTQDINYQNVHECKVNLPGSTKLSETPLLFVRLDPFQAVVNFGPDSLAVEFSGS